MRRRTVSYSTALHRPMIAGDQSCSPDRAPAGERGVAPRRRTARSPAEAAGAMNEDLERIRRSHRDRPRVQAAALRDVLAALGTAAAARAVLHPAQHRPPDDPHGATW